MKIALISTCTNRKKRVPQSHLCAQNLPKGNLDSLISCWKNRLNRDVLKIAAKELYCGRGFAEILKVINNGNVDLWIVSAGLGLIESDQKVPSYNLTISPGSINSIQDKIIQNHRFSTKEWWSELNLALNGTRFPVKNLIEKNRDTIFIFSLSNPYMEFISNDLFRLKKKDLHRIRLMGFRDTSFLPHHFKELWMPYNECFDGPDSKNPGTCADFPQRVARQFIEDILFTDLKGSPQQHSELVSDSLKAMRPPTRIKRTTLTDDEIIKIVLNRWNEAKGNGSRMLRILRDDEMIACEQARFASIFKKIKSRIT